MKKVIPTTNNHNKGKLQPNWEGPYLISRMVNCNAYYLLNSDKEELKSLKNIMNLRKWNQCQQDTCI
ncbi:hypothetical protein GIB67_008129 [Kingdonia uniflora]|uniref:Uncharacterized protein n=1 Tax=Kingdonia uniflora TaxID=39325 RepID=A0A7J7MT92_9MAGN|nr:hypothetical protein GIB67_008129 [Kingdonia uniflora]